MSTISRVTTWTSGQTLKAADLNGEFNNITNYLNNADSGSTTWNRVLATNATSVPLIVNNSTGSQNIANFQTNGTNSLTIGTNGLLSLSSSLKEFSRLSTSLASQNNYVTFLTSGSSSSVGFQIGQTGSNNMAGIQCSNGNLNLFAGGTDGTVLDGTAMMTITTNGNIGIGAAPNAAALFHITSTTKGFLPPSMTTTQRGNISSPPAGLLIYNNSTNKINVFTGGGWEAVTSA